MKQWKWVIIALTLVVVLGGSYALYSSLSDSYRPNIATVPKVENNMDDGENLDNGEEKQLAPDFTALDGAGNTVKLSDYKGTPVVLNFWASWCPPCKAELPDFNDACTSHTDVQFLMVNLTDGERETMETAQAFLNEAGYDFPVLFDVDSDAAVTYRVSAIPSTYFIDRDGYIVGYAQGMIDAQTLEEGIGYITQDS